uniref:Uncharacterized protein At2g01560 n=1 Tax=Arabidopsis thaliana TaxID=3702 RepID=Q9ZVE9_ARATH|nr:hypothetical protein [Arabidopsis thaliana]
MSPHVLDLPKGCEISNDLTDFVHYRVEECIQGYMSKEETASFIFDTFGVSLKFTRFVWYLLEKANPDFFRCFKTHCENIQNAPSEEVTSNVEIENSFEDLAEASTSFTKPDNKPRAKRSKGKNKQKQHPISPIHSLIETAPNDASSQVPQEAATANSSDTPIPVEKVSTRGTSADVERAEVPIADAEIILKQISTRMRLLESIIEQVHKLLSNVLGPPPSAAKALKKQRSWKQVRGDYEQAEMLHDLNQQVQQEMPRMDIPGNQASDNSNEEDTLYD